MRRLRTYDLPGQVKFGAVAAVGSLNRSANSCYDVRILKMICLNHLKKLSNKTIHLVLIAANSDDSFATR